ncbi:protoporphyrinogen oxidase HemJ [Phormidesmis priestleyi]
MAYLWFKAFHIVGIVCWFAGLFYLPRLFVYHAEANEQPEPARSILKNQYQIMEKRLYRIIMTPALILTIVMAIGLVYTEPDVLKQPWLQIKLALVAALLVYDHLCLRIMKKLAADTCKMTGQQFRWFNEFPTVLFVIIVMLAIFKNDVPTDATAWLIFGMTIAMAAFIQLYARKRRLAKEKLVAEGAISESVSEVGA